MNVELHTEQGVKVIVPLVRRLDASVASAFKQQVLEALDGQTKNLVLDLSHVDFIDSSCLGAWYPFSRASVGRESWCSARSMGQSKTCSSSPAWIASFRLKRLVRMH